jgi:nitrate/nitrite transporter NarK
MTAGWRTPPDHRRRRSSELVGSSSIGPPQRQMRARAARSFRCVKPVGDLRLAALLAGGCSWNLTAMGANPDALAAAFGTGLAAIGLLGGVLWLPHALAQFPAGQLVGRFGLRRVAAVSLVGLAIADAAACLVADPVFVGFTRFAAGSFCGGGMLAAAMYAHGTTAVGQGLMGAATSVGAAAPLALVPVLEPVMGWRTPFLVGIGLAVAVLAGVLVIGRDRPSRAATDESGAGMIRTVLGDAVLLRLSLLLTATTLLSWTVGYWIVSLLTLEDRFDPVAAGLIGALTLAGGVVGRPLGGLIDSRTGRGGLLVAASFVVGGACLIGVVSGVPLYLTIPATFSIGLCAGLPFAAILHAASTARPGAAAAGLGMVGTAGTLGGVVTIPLVGVAFSAGHGEAALIALAGTVLMCAAAVPQRHGLNGRARARPRSALAGAGRAERAER